MKTPTFCVVSCLSASVLLAQGLGGAARKEQERRKKNAEAGIEARTFGNGELLDAMEGKGTFSAGVADASGNPGMQEPAGETVPMPPARVAADQSNVRPVAEQPEETEMDRLKAKLAHWRAAFQPLKNRADALEREVADLQEKASRSGLPGPAPGKPIFGPGRAIIGYESSGSSGPRPLHEGEAARLRLPHAREELARAKLDLERVENEARRDGIAPGQLY